MRQLLSLSLVALLVSCAPQTPPSVRLAEQVKFVSSPVNTVEGKKDGFYKDCPVVEYALPLKDEYGRLWGEIAYRDRGEVYSALGCVPCPPDPVHETRAEARRKQYDEYQERVKNGLPAFPFSHHLRKVGGIYSTDTLDVAAFREFIRTTEWCEAMIAFRTREHPDGYVSRSDQLKVRKLIRNDSDVDTVSVFDPYFADDPVNKIADEKLRSAAEKRRDEWFRIARDLMEKNYGLAP